MDEIIFKILKDIYLKEKNSYGNINLFDFNKVKLSKLLSKDAIEYIESGKCKYGVFNTYGGGLGIYTAINPTSSFYQQIKGGNQ